MNPRLYGSHVVDMWVHLNGDRWQYSIDGITTLRGQRGTKSMRGAWKAAKSEITKQEAKHAHA